MLRGKMLPPCGHQTPVDQSPTRATEHLSHRSGKAWGADGGFEPFGEAAHGLTHARVGEGALVSGQEAPRSLWASPSSGWRRYQAWSPQSLPVQRPAACLPGPLPGLAPLGDPSIMPAKWMQKAMAPLKRQMSPRLEEPEGSCLQHRTQPWVQFPAPHPLNSPPASKP